MKCPPAPGEEPIFSRIKRQIRIIEILRDRSPRETIIQMDGIRKFKEASKLCPRMKAMEGTVVVLLE